MIKWNSIFNELNFILNWKYVHCSNRHYKFLQFQNRWMFKNYFTILMHPKMLFINTHTCSLSQKLTTIHHHCDPHTLIHYLFLSTFFWLSKPMSTFFWLGELMVSSDDTIFFPRTSIWYDTELFYWNSVFSILILINFTGNRLIRNG